MLYREKAAGMYSTMAYTIAQVTMHLNDRSILGIIPVYATGLARMMNGGLHVAGDGGITLHVGAAADLLIYRVPNDRVPNDDGQVLLVLHVPGDELHVLHAIRDGDGCPDPQHRDRHGAVFPHLHLLERLLWLHHRERGTHYHLNRLRNGSDLLTR